MTEIDILEVQNYVMQRIYQQIIEWLKFIMFKQKGNKP